jgi:hypothetical protein
MPNKFNRVAPLFVGESGRQKVHDLIGLVPVNPRQGAIDRPREPPCQIPIVIKKAWRRVIDAPRHRAKRSGEVEHKDCPRPGDPRRLGDRGQQEVGDSELEKLTSLVGIKVLQVRY